jgi:site-specific DNA recombinase
MKMYIPWQSPKWICTACKNKIPITDLDAIFREQLHDYMTSLQHAVPGAANHNADQEHRRHLIANLQTERKRVASECDRCYELFSESAINRDQFKERFQPLDQRKKEIDQEIPRLEAEIAKIERRRAKVEDLVSYGKLFHEAWPKMPFEQQLQLVEAMVQKITIGEEVIFELFALPAIGKTADGQRFSRDSWPRPT